MKWIAWMIRILSRKHPPVDPAVVRSQALLNIAKVRRAHVASLRPQSEQAHDDLEEWLNRALRGE